MHDCALHVLVEGHYQTTEFGGTANLLQKLEKAFSTDEVEHLSQVDEGEVEWLPLLPALPLYLTDGEDHVDRGSSGSEPTLGLGVDAYC